MTVPMLTRFVLAAVLCVAMAAHHAQATTMAAGPGQEPDICLTVDATTMDGAAWPALVAAVDDAMASRPTLIPDRSVVTTPSPALGGGAASRAGERWRVGVWSTGGSEPGSPAQHAVALAHAACGSTEAAWSATFAGSFLRAGTQRELAAAPSTPGFESSIDVEWQSGEPRIRTALRFSGPLGIPNGTCWMDDLLRVDAAGVAGADVETGFTTSPFGEGVCGRFEAFLPHLCASAQPLFLPPSLVAL
ncbi:hypothetical protein BH24CHL9_BH24CHL9_16730 [soil metagenome]